MLEIDVRHLAFVETRRALLHIGEIEAFDDLGDVHDLRVVLRRPAKERKIIAHGGRQVVTILILLDERAAIAFAHLALAFLRILENEREVGKLRDRHPERLVKVDVLGGVAQVVLAAHDVRDAHRDVVDDIHKMEGRAAIRAHEDEVTLLAAFHPATDEVVDHDRLGAHLLDLGLEVFVVLGIPLAFEAEPLGAVFLVGRDRPRAVFSSHSR